ncbi:MAG: ParB/RepB/Spo0J family partition protein [Flavobacteriaceae bacterium]
MAKSKQRQALGRGLSALLNNPENEILSANDQQASEVIGNIVALSLESIEVNPNQPRTHFNEESLQELAMSIKELGVIQPITVRKMAGNQFQLVSGERRFRAAKSIGLENIPAYVRLANDQESLEMALVENIQREDLDPIEIALSYQRLIDEIQLTQNQLSERVGKKRSTIANYIRLLKLDPIIQTGMRDGFLSMGHGRALINVEDPKEQLNLYEKVIAQKLSVRETENLVKNTKNRAPQPKIHQPAYFETAAQEMEDLLGSSVRVRMSAQGKGSIHISFSSQADLERILNRIKQ